MVYNYDDYIIEKNFNSILCDIERLVESGKWSFDNIDEIRHKKIIFDKFLSNLPKDKIKYYFNKFIKYVSNFNLKSRKSIIAAYIFIFLSYVSYEYLINDNLEITTETKDVITQSIKRSNFDNAHYIVKEVEKGYSSDKKDRGNYIKTKSGRKFIGTNHGISAPILMNYLGRVPSVEDMKNLTYDEAIEIFEKIYWDSQNLSELSNQSIANLIYDGCVNQGISAMRTILKKTYIKNNIEVNGDDNIFDTRLLNKLNSKDPSKIFNDIKHLRKERYENSITFKIHGAGWINRINKIKFE